MCIICLPGRKTKFGKCEQFSLESRISHHEFTYGHHVVCAVCMCAVYLGFFVFD